MTVSVIITADDGKVIHKVEEHGLKVDDIYIPGHHSPSILKALAAFQKRQLEQGAAAQDI